MRKMTSAEIHTFLAEASRIATIATVRPDGHPHAVPMWFVLDGDDVVLTTGSRSAKARHLRHEPRVSLSVDDDQPPYAFVSCLGIATLQHRPADLVDWTTRVARRYVGEDAAAEVGRRNAEYDDLVVRVRITSAVGQADLL
jgi:PPOX class probable F420-dependent enzyme